MYEVEGHSVTMYEERPPWDGVGEWRPGQAQPEHSGWCFRLSCITRGRSADARWCASVAYAGGTRERAVARRLRWVDAPAVAFAHAAPMVMLLPPTWVQNEVAWQSLNNGDAHPQKCFWALTLASRAACLDGHATSYLKSYPTAVTAYVIVLRGRFTTPDYPGKTFATMYFVILENGHGYVAGGLESAAHKLKLLPAMHSYVPRMPVASGVWGHAFRVGGPFPGGPFLLRNVPVAVFAGSKAAGQPLTTLRSDADGFFTLDLQPGVYTLALTDRDHGFGRPDTVTVRAGAPVAAAVHSDVS